MFVVSLLAYLYVMLYSNISKSTLVFNYLLLHSAGKYAVYQEFSFLVA